MKNENKKADPRKAAQKPETLKESKPQAAPQAEGKLQVESKPQGAPQSEAEAKAESLWKQYNAVLAGLPFGYTTEEEAASLKAALEEASKPSPEAVAKAKAAKEAYSEAEKKAKAAQGAFAFGYTTKEKAEAAQAEAEAKKAAWKEAEKAAKGFSFKGGSGSRSKGPMSGIEAAYKILCESEKPMRCKELAEAAISGGLWAPDGLTPEMTLSAAIQGEIKKKGDNSRFIRTAPGLFTVRKAEGAAKA